MQNKHKTKEEIELEEAFNKRLKLNEKRHTVLYSPAQAARHSASKIELHDDVHRQAIREATGTSRTVATDQQLW